jgi:hypothetical protein
MQPIVTLLFTLLVLPILSPALAFTDLTQSRYSEAILYLSDQQIVSGYPDGTFQPQRLVTRAELIALTMRAAGLPQGARAQACFRDVPPSSWFAADVCNARAHGIVSGYEDGSFRPAHTVSYAEALKIVLTALDFDIRSDGAGVWHEPYVTFATTNRLPVELEPTDPLTREIMAGSCIRPCASRMRPCLPCRLSSLPRPWRFAARLAAA